MKSFYWCTMCLFSEKFNKSFYWCTMCTGPRILYFPSVTDQDSIDTDTWIFISSPCAMCLFSEEKKSLNFNSFSCDSAILNSFLIGILQISIPDEESARKNENLYTKCMSISPGWDLPDSVFEKIIVGYIKLYTDRLVLLTKWQTHAVINPPSC